MCLRHTEEEKIKECRVIKANRTGDTCAMRPYGYFNGFFVFGQREKTKKEEARRQGGGVMAGSWSRRRDDGGEPVQVAG